eukprot:TRINITY_DN8691_c0_g2_i1.p5 TRINITY_DN8691_c0_g2~~TRINITY_DN8691_c0_g2_i1.p5  ORF type:complete len:110 (+),score=25.15 TRINITY_DN8691_c0_g2_i1:47-331(+)
MPSCPAGAKQDSTCTAEEIASGKCVEASMCCKTIKCRKEVPIQEPPFCCQAVPTCPSGFTPTDPAQCSALMWRFGICKEVSRCCKTLTCRTWVW